MKRTSYLIIALLGTIAAGLWLESSITLVSQARATESTATYDLDTIKKHDNANNCWLIVRGTVYDVTSYIPSHPTAPEVISRYCGQDATQAFETKDKSRPRDHSGKAWDLLERYRIGVTKQ